MYSAYGYTDEPSFAAGSETGRRISDETCLRMASAGRISAGCLSAAEFH